MKHHFSSALLALLLVLNLSACGQPDAVSSANIYYPPAEATSSLADLPEAENSSVPEEGPGDVSLGNDSSGKSDEGNGTVAEDGWYTSKDEVALYIHLYGQLPGNYVTKDEAEEAGWHGGSVERYTGEGTAIGGSPFGNREGLLPKAQGRYYTECDIDTAGESSRGAKRIVFSNDGLVYYTEDHYESFELLYGQP